MVCDVCVCVCVLDSQSCLTMLPHGLESWSSSSVHGILQARVGLAFPSGDLPDPGIEPGSPALQADSLLFERPGKPHSLLCSNR